MRGSIEQGNKHPGQSGKRTAVFHKRKKRRWLPVGILVAVPAAVIIVMAISLFAFRDFGKQRLYGQAVQDGTSLNDVLEEGLEHPEEEWKDGWVRYQGDVYAYNEDILTFLILGIDKSGEVSDAEDGIDGGQSDLLFLAVLDPHKGRLSVIAINRNTMAWVDRYDRDGSFLATEKLQINLQHGYGDGKEQSCERSVQAVSRLFYGLPVHGYCAVNMDAIPLINDAVGGVDVTVLETLKNSRLGISFMEGEQVHLEGKNAFWYVKYRDVNVFDSAGGRLKRQQQYLKAWAAKAKEAVKSSPGVILELYRTVTNYMVTDVTADEAAYLAAEALDCDFSGEDIYSLEGETVIGAGGFEEFYPDEEALYGLIIGIFYEKVEDETVPANE